MVLVNRIKYFHCLADGFKAPFDVSKEKKPLDKIPSGPRGGLCPVNVDSRGNFLFPRPTGGNCGIKPDVKPFKASLYQPAMGRAFKVVMICSVLPVLFSQPEKRGVCPECHAGGCPRTRLVPMTVGNSRTTPGEGGGPGLVDLGQELFTWGRWTRNYMPIVRIYLGRRSHLSSGFQMGPRHLERLSPRSGGLLNVSLLRCAMKKSHFATKF